jgi:hypothetical protein
MSATRRVTFIIFVVLGLGLSTTLARAQNPDKDDRKCISATTSAVQKFMKTKLKVLSKCREKEGNPTSTVCPGADDQTKIANALSQMRTKINKKCTDKLDPKQALDYTGCPAIPGCQADQNASPAGYAACIECASETVSNLIARSQSPGACGNQGTGVVRLQMQLLRRQPGVSPVHHGRGLGYVWNAEKFPVLGRRRGFRKQRV